MLDLILKATSDIGFTTDRQGDDSITLSLGSGRVTLLLTPDGNPPTEQYPHFSMTSSQRMFNEYPDQTLAGAVHQLDGYLQTLPTQLLWHHRRPDGHFKLERVYQSDTQATRLTLNIFNQTY